MLISGIVAILSAVAYFVYPYILPTSEPSEKAVAHVMAEYHYEVTLADTPVEFEGLKFRYPKDSELITKLMKVYQEETGDMGEAISIGGGTYARAIGNAVAFGPNFLNRPDICHQPDEHIYLSDFILWIAIYAKAIYLLAK